MTNSNHGLPVCENILNRDFHATRPGEKADFQSEVSDITYLHTAQGWLYLTIVLDLFDRKVIGWAFGMAYMNRRPRSGLMFHSDRGVRYCAASLRIKLDQRCPTVRQSMSWKGNCWDNACAESFFKTLKSELAVLDGTNRRWKYEIRCLNTLRATITGNGCIRRLTIRHRLRHYVQKWLNLLSSQPGQFQNNTGKRTNPLTLQSK
jgi:transposase InsO family protein